MDHPGDPAPAESDTTLEGLIKSLDIAGRESNKVLVRWLLDAEVPLLSACILITLDPEDAPLRAGEVAEAIGISIDDATLALFLGQLLPPEQTHRSRRCRRPPRLPGAQGRVHAQKTPSWSARGAEIFDLHPVPAQMHRLVPDAFVPDADCASSVSGSTARAHRRGRAAVRRSAPCRRLRGR
jgi:hypothetical protein